MTREGAVSIKDWEQQKDGHTAGLLRTSPRKDEKKEKTSDTIGLLHLRLAMT
ncbi:MAG: hypothetical protein RRY07_10335 [Bacteroidaceae bacterium]